VSSVQPVVAPSREHVAGAGVVLQTLALTKIYRMGEVDVHALRGIDLALHEGEFMVLLGVSGSGKSTLLNILGGLDVPTSGRRRTIRWLLSGRRRRPRFRRRSPESRDLAQYRTAGNWIAGRGRRIPPTRSPVATPLLNPGQFLMQRRILLGIKQRAERARSRCC